jgi:hypothetical protein
MFSLPQLRNKRDSQVHVGDPRSYPVPPQLPFLLSSRRTRLRRRGYVRPTPRPDREALAGRARQGALFTKATSVHYSWCRATARYRSKSQPLLVAASSLKRRAVAVSAGPFPKADRAHRPPGRPHPVITSCLTTPGSCPAPRSGHGHRAGSARAAAARPARRGRVRLRRGGWGGVGE